MKKYSFLFSYFKKAKMLSLFFLMIISSVLTLLPPYLISYILDEGVVKASIKTIVYCSICLVFTYICSFAVNYFISQNLTKTSSYFIADLKNDLFAKILKLPMEFFDKQQTGYIFERIKETESLNIFFSPVFLKFVTSIVSFVGIVAQNIVLFSGTLLDNIRFIAPELDECEIISALNKAGLDVSEFAGGLQAEISENGKNLSGGQKQKIALARMIVKNPDVMIFDEATSNLDIETSDLVKQSIHTIFAEKTCIIITHDPDMASLADNVIEL